MLPPRLDHHQHLLNEGESRVTVDYVRGRGWTDYANRIQHEPLVDADQLVRALDSAGIPKALVFSNAYFFARDSVEQQGEAERLRADNDWTLTQIQRHPSRLYAACSVNPLRGYAVAEIERCAASGGFRALKIHFDASGVNLRNAEHVAAVRLAFATANRVRLPIVVHVQSETGYDGGTVRTFLEGILPAAPGVPVTINHLWGGGAYGDEAAEALKVFAGAFERKDAVTNNLWFDVAQASMMVSRDRHRAELVDRMRQIGIARMLYGSDGSQWNGVPAKQHWEDFSRCMPLTREELTAIATNVAPYLR